MTVRVEERLPLEAGAGSPGRGFFWGALGVLSFSVTLPATKLALTELDATFIALGRALVAAVVAGAWLWFTRQRWPTASQWRRLAIVAGGVVVGFPLLSAWALRLVPASHGAVLIGLLPAATTVVSTVRGGERPSPWFWAAALAGLASVLTFAATRDVHRLTAADALMLFAVASASLGYAEGGALAKELGGPAVISWALLLAVPFIAPAVAWSALHTVPTAGLRSWLCFGYVGVVSMCLGFFAWYRGMAEGGVARVSQLQLAQPILTLVWSAWWLGESVQLANVVAALAVAACVVATWRARVGGPPALASVRVGAVSST